VNIGASLLEPKKKIKKRKKGAKRKENKKELLKLRCQRLFA